jgi:hypothetical protein
MNRTITGEMHVVLDGVGMAPPGPPWSYLGVARALTPAVRVLADSPAGQGIPVALLAGHAAECALKAYLSRGGDDAALMRDPIRHDLMGLWRQAVAEGLAVVDPPPDWLVRLGEVHGKPYHLRYSRHVHGVVTPNADLLAEGLAALLATVEAALPGAR